MIKAFDRFRRAFRHFQTGPFGMGLLGLMIAVGLMYAGGAVYQGFHADIRKDMVTAMQAGSDTEADMVSTCVQWSKRQGVSDDVCQPFADTEWAIMNGGKPLGDQEGLPDWLYTYYPDGTMITGPGRIRIWVPADRQSCPQIIVGTMTDGMCPTWMDVPQ